MKNILKKVGPLSWVLLVGGLISAFMPIVEDVRDAEKEKDEEDEEEDIKK